MNDKIAGKITIILPTYNEKNNIGSMVAELNSIMPEADILIVDDNSPDGTGKIVKELIPQYSNLSLLERPLKTGLGDAYKEAIKKIIADKNIYAVITMDADGSHQPKYLKDFLEYIKDYDLVIGSRYIAGGGVENWEFWRRLLSKFGNLYAKILTGLKISDLTAGFMCARRDLLEKIDFDGINSAGYAYLIEFKFYCINKLGAKVKETPIIFKERRMGESKISNQIITEGIKAPLRIFWRRLWKK